MDPCIDIYTNSEYSSGKDTDSEDLIPDIIVQI